MDDLIAKITEKYNIPADKARGIVATVVEFLKDKLPAPVAGQIEKLMGGGGEALGGVTDKLGDAAGGVTDKLGGMFGK